MSKPLFRDRQTALGIGILATVAAAVCLWDAYESRGKSRPFWTKFMPGPV